MKPSADRRVRFVSPRQLRIEEEIAYHSFELKNLTMELDASNAGMHRVGQGYGRGAGHFVQDHPRYCPIEEDSSTLLSHDSFSVEASIDYAKPKSSSKWTRSASPFRVRGRSKSPGRNRSTNKSRSADRKSSHRLSERERGRSPGRGGGGRGRDRHYDM